MRESSWNPFAGAPLPLVILFWIAFGLAIASLISITTLIIAGRYTRHGRPSGPATESEFLWVFLVPALNEAVTIADSVGRLRQVQATNRLIFVINDGSDDATGEILEGLRGDDVAILTRRLPEARLGKAAALNDAVGHLTRRLESDPAFARWTPDRVVVAIVDADGRLDPAAPLVLAPHFSDRLIGGVQVRVEIYNRGRYLTWAQQTEFASFGLIFQAGRAAWGTANMGGNGQFNRLSALLSIIEGPGPWRDRLTEDQDLGVRLIQNGWKGAQQNGTRVEQQGVSSIRRLYRQRTRWAQGTLQSLPLLRGVGAVRGRVARADAVFYLLTPIFQMIVGLDVVLTLILGIFFGVPFIPAAIVFILGSITLGFGPGFVSLVLTRRGIRGVLWAIVAVIPYTAYSWLIYPTLYSAAFRQLTRRTGWAKTAREPLAAADSG
jgi:cellulose synthase/poly-beta-1,6-N-acetylglucosamine synthase-like glycosyltransferase